MKSVTILMGSPNDWPVMKKAAETLASLGVPFEVHVASAHRDPARVVEIVASAREQGAAAVVCAAGMAAHLAGVAAAHTTLPAGRNSRAEWRRRSVGQWQHAAPDRSAVGSSAAGV